MKMQLIEVNKSFISSQSDIYESGLAGQIGAIAYFVLGAIKTFADYNSGLSWPGMRKLCQITGLSLGSIHKAIHVLIQYKLLRLCGKGHKGIKGQTYIARERLQIKICELVICNIYVDYVPVKIRDQIKNIELVLDGEQSDIKSKLLAEIEIEPGSGFFWDEQNKVLRGKAEISLMEEKNKKLAEKEENASAFEKGKIFISQLKSRKIPPA
jgi:hypothetical protein